MSPSLWPLRSRARLMVLLLSVQNWLWASALVPYVGLRARMLGESGANWVHVGDYVCNPA
eukprot:6490620-Amphidinium_carterae.4